MGSDADIVLLQTGIEKTIRAGDLHELTTHPGRGMWSQRGRPPLSCEARLSWTTALSTATFGTDNFSSARWQTKYSAALPSRE